MTLPPLACPVRACGAPLARQARALVCPRAHTFDLARSGYVNLLQPQDRRSPRAGDTAEALDARARLAAAGVGRALTDEIVDRIRGWPFDAPPAVVDLGCGTGELLAAIADARPIVGTGLDLSTAAVERAARRRADLTWVVGNADRRLPFGDGTVDVVLSTHARRNAAECARVLKPDGRLLVAVPAPDDLVELRTRVMGESAPRARVEAVVAEHDRQFQVAARWTVRERRHLDLPALADLLRGTYRGARRSTSARVERLEPMTVTLESDVLVLVPRRR
ncbi:MAG: methyltransferase domain-containing protein [Acidobacteriota bacterium]